MQLTWDYNYRNMGKVLGNRLLYEPELALDADVAYGIMSYGMRNGSFTGARLSRFINGDTCDYVNARKIINGLDQAERIAGYAQKLETVLRASVVAAVPGGVPTPQPAAAGASPPRTGSCSPSRAASLNVRSGPGAGNPTVAGSPLAQGTTVHGRRGAGRVDADRGAGSGVTGWVSAKYLQAAAPQIFTVTADSLNVRSGPGAGNPTVRRARCPGGRRCRCSRRRTDGRRSPCRAPASAGWVSSSTCSPPSPPTPERWTIPAGEDDDRRACSPVVVVSLGGASAAHPQGAQRTIAGVIHTPSHRGQRAALRIR